MEIPKEVADAIARGAAVAEFTVMDMNNDRQKDLKAYTDQTADKDDDLAWRAACAMFATTLVLESQFGVDLVPAEVYQKCVDAGAILKKNAYINSYEKIAQVCGLKVKKFESLYISSNEDKLVDLLRNRVPLVMFLGAPNELNHVEAAHGFIRTEGETLVLLKDPGFQGDTHFGLADRRTFHFENGQRKYSIIDHGTLANTQRKAYKFGYFVV